MGYHYVTFLFFQRYIYLFILCVGVFYLHVWPYLYQKKALDPTTDGFEPHVVAGN